MPAWALGVQTLNVHFHEISFPGQMKCFILPNNKQFYCEENVMRVDTIRIFFCREYFWEEKHFVFLSCTLFLSNTEKSCISHTASFYKFFCCCSVTLSLPRQASLCVHFSRLLLHYLRQKRDTFFASSVTWLQTTYKGTYKQIAFPLLKHSNDCLGTISEPEIRKILN
jgi:hypothetical protein